MEDELYNEYWAELEEELKELEMENEEGEEEGKKQRPMGMLKKNFFSYGRKRSGTIFLTPSLVTNFTLPTEKSCSFKTLIPIALSNEEKK